MHFEITPPFFDIFCKFFLSSSRHLFADQILKDVLIKLAKSGPSGPGSLRAPRLLRPFGPGHVLGFGPSRSEFWGVALYGAQIFPLCHTQCPDTLKIALKQEFLVLGAWRLRDPGSHLLVD